VHFSGRSDEQSSKQVEKITVVYHPLAVEELIESSEFYELRESGLGTRFLKTIDKSLELLKRNPRISKADHLGRRKYVVNRFPFLLIYKFKENRIVVLAVAHGSRRPGYWKERVM
jgi:toxin ParE1/3/4